MLQKQPSCTPKCCIPVSKHTHTGWAGYRLGSPHPTTSCYMYNHFLPNTQPTGAPPQALVLMYCRPNTLFFACPSPCMQPLPQA